MNRRAPSSTPRSAASKPAASASSLNFGFLADDLLGLESLGAEIEQLCGFAPKIAIQQARTFLEGLLLETYRRFELAPPPSSLPGNTPCLYDFERDFCGREPQPPYEVRVKIKRIRDEGNDASHWTPGRVYTGVRAVEVLEDLFDVARWVHLAYFCADAPRTPGAGRFQRPRVATSASQAEHEVARLRARVRELEAAPREPPRPLDVRRAVQAGRQATAALALDGAAARRFVAERAPFGLAHTYADARNRLGTPERLQRFEALTREAFDAIPLLPVPGGRDPQLRLVVLEGSPAWAVVVLLLPAADARFLVYAGPRAEAVAWARIRRFEAHPMTGALQEVLDPPAAAPPLAPAAAPGPFAGLTTDDLLALGVPRPLIPAVRAVGACDADVWALLEHLPAEAREPLLDIATGAAAGPRVEQARAFARERAAAPPELAYAHPDAERRFFLPPTRADLARVLGAPLEAWRIFLHPTQRALVARRFHGPARVLGGAGTGKTVVALHRARHLLAHVFAGPGDRVLFTTFSRSLAENLRPLLQSLCGDDFARLEVVHLDQLAVQLVREADGEAAIERIAAEGDDAWKSAMDAALAPLPKSGALPRSFVRSELRWALAHHGLDDRDAYLRLPRKGRGRRLTRADRVDILEAHQRLRVALAARPLFSDIHRRARAVLAARPAPPFRAVVVDEAQDMHGEQLRLIRGLAAPGPDDLFLVGDPHQRIYTDPLCFSDFGLPVRGRSAKLTVNYRTTEEIRRAAVRALGEARFDDLDGDDDTAEGARSERRGPAPTFQGFATPEAEADAASAAVAALLARGVSSREVGVFAPTKVILQRVEASLKARGLAVWSLQQRELDDGDGVRTATLHRAKGLEFLHVFVLGLARGVLPHRVAVHAADDGDREHVDRQQRSLLYVSLSRARETLSVSWHGQPSPFLAPHLPGAAP